MTQKQFDEAFEWLFSEEGEWAAATLFSQRMKKEDEFNAKRASDMSVFYGNEDASSDAYSILSYKYSNNKNIK